MALKPLNSVGGFSVGETPSNVIYPNGDFSGNKANFSGNVAALGLLTDNLYYANGTPWDLQEAAGANTEIQFNIGNNFAASANFTFNSTTNLLTVTGNSNVTGRLSVGGVSNLGPIGNVFVTGGTNGQVISTDGAGNLSFVTIDTYQIQNGNSNVVVAANSNVTVAANGINVLTVSGYGGNAANNITNIAGQLGVSGNVTALNFVGNITGNITIPGSNTGVVFNDGGVANSSLGFTFDNTSNAVTANGNLTVNNANLGNLATANFINVSSNLNVTDTMQAGNVRTDNLLYANGNPWDLQEAAGSNTEIQFNIDDNFAASANLTYDDATQLFTVLGNAQFNNANLGNLATANFVNVASNVVSSNLTVNLALDGNTANFTGNVSAGNLSTTGSGGNITMSGGNITGANVISANTFDSNLVTANFANISSNTITNNLTVNLELAGNTANFSGNINALNANLGNLAIANFVQTGQVFLGNSNVAIAPNANITFSVAGTANLLTVSSVGANIVGYVSANGNGTFGALKSNSVTAQGGNLELYSEQAGNTYIQLRPFGTGTVDVGNVRITSLAMPNASSDAATKQYVDDVAQGLNVHDSALAATSNTLANLTGGVITYNNGASGVGANLVLSGTPTANYLSANVFDGNVTAIVTSRILVKDEANAAFNGIYVVSNATVLTRADDFNTVPEVEAGDFVFVQDGTTYNDSGWVQTSVVAVIGTDPITWTQFSGAGTYQAGQGLTLTGTVFSVNVDNITTEISGGNVIVKANAQFTTPNIGAATGTSVDLTGNVLADNVNANAKVTAANVDVTSNVLANNFSANSNITANNATINLALSGNTANFSGNVVVSNLAVNLELAGNTANFSSNVVVNNLGVNLALAGNTANFSGNIVSLNANLGNLLTANFANIASNVVAGNLISNALTSTRVPYVGVGNNLTDSTNLTWDNPNQVLKIGAGGTEIGGDAGFGYIQTKTGNFSGNINSLNANLGNLLTANFANIASNITTSNLSVNLALTGNTANFSGNLTANNLILTNDIEIGNTNIGWGTVTTSSISANQTISQFTVTGVTGVEFLVKGVDATGTKYSMSTVTAVTDGSQADYVTFATAVLGGSTGSLVVNVTGGNVALQVTPSSSNTTVWTAQYRTI